MTTLFCKKRKRPPAQPEIGPPKPKHIVVLTGAGFSAESGLPTFRDSDGLWQNHSIYEVASLTGKSERPNLTPLMMPWLN
jgi:NAD-dependent SIR2 family protein deacetylase